MMLTFWILGGEEWGFGRRRGAEGEEIGVEVMVEAEVGEDGGVARLRLRRGSGVSRYALPRRE